MRIESKLCHLTENKAIVQVNGWINGENFGSALAEGETVEVAEDKAISRLIKRINGELNNEKISNPTQETKIKTSLNVESPNSDKIENININNEPSDWSDELTAIDSEIHRLKWNRDEEINFLEEKMGYNNRNKITNYSDIVKYLSLLKNTHNQTPSKVVKGNINTLIEESNIILRHLSWDHIQGREYLQNEFNVSTRKELNEKQLISFVEKLKSIRNQNQTH